MQREIGFRGKRVDNGKWANGFYCYIGHAGKEKHTIIPSFASAYYGFPVIPETIGQYTGLKDKNGQKIFEGDIIVIPNKYPYYDYPEGINKSVNEPLYGEVVLNYVGVVEWVYSQWQVILNCVNPKKRGASNGINNSLNDDGIDDGENSKWEVIGNIHDNSDILGGNE